MWQYNYPDELYHYGRKGMRWYQHIFTKEGSSSLGRPKTTAEINERAAQKAAKIKAKSTVKTAKIEAKARVKEAKKAAKLKSDEEKVLNIESKTKVKNAKIEAKDNKSIKEMSDEELKARVDRIKLEQDYLKYNPKQVSAGKRFASALVNNVVIPAAQEGGKQLAKEFLAQKGGEALGLREKKNKDK